jgi:MFS family permease
VLIGEFGWRSMFLISVPLGMATWLLAQRYLPDDRPAQSARTGFDPAGTLLLALSLAAYALAMTLGRAHFGLPNIVLLLAACLCLGLFVRVESRVAAPLVRLALFRDSRFSGSLAMSLLVTTVMMATLLVGPFYLSQTLRLSAMEIGLVLSVGPLVAALTGVPAGRIVDRCGAPGITLAGLLGMALGCLMLSLVPESFGVGGFLAPMVVLTLGYAVFQTANNTAVMLDVAPDQRGVVSGLLNLSRNLGLVTGASALGAVFALASRAVDIGTAHPQAIASGLRTTFLVALGLIVVACLIAWRRQANRR